MLRGSKAIVTGASRGIGLAIANMLVKEGCRVIITGRNEEALSRAAASIGACPKVWDAADLSAWPAHIEEAAATLGGLDILVNNAGIFCQSHSEWDPDALLETTVDEWERVMHTNTSALFFAMQAAVAYMRRSHVAGNILNITSVAGYEPVRGAYGASKIAASGLTRGWGLMYAKDGIVINGIAPGPVATEMNHWHEGDPLDNPRVPAGRFATADEVAELARYLLSPAACMVCGETVVLDGAYAIR